MMPILTFAGMAAGIIGGFLVAVALSSCALMGGGDKPATLYRLGAGALTDPEVQRCRFPPRLESALD
jgi:hypothetical protein